jgi:hypothetical protein
MATRAGACALLQTMSRQPASSTGATPRKAQQGLGELDVWWLAAIAA